MAALVAGIALISLYREGTADRLRRAEAAVARGCDAILERTRFTTAGTARLDWTAPETAQALTAASLLALRDLPGVEGGLWRNGTGPLAYAYPTYEGAEAKTDVPAAELPRIREVAEAAAERGMPIDRRYDARSQALLLHACPLPEPGLAGWTMTRVVLVGGPAFVRAAVALGALSTVLLGSAAWLGWLLLGWSRRLRRIEAALTGTQAAELPRLEPTGQRDLDRIVHAMNTAASRVAEARAAATAAAARATEAERLAGLGRIAAGVAHEVRNPIAAMRLKAENALATGDPDRMARALRVVLDRVARLDALTRDLLGAARGGMPLTPALVEPDALVAGRVAFYQEPAAAAGVALTALGAALGPARVDAARLERAIDNLILNALQATPRGGRVVVSAIRRGGALVLAVTDTGAGVPEALRTWLFEPFASGRADGIGLGLALVREAAEAHGGTVQALHRPDGTTIEITLPEEPPAVWPIS
ncbi:sensor histidine kinase [Dankookia sp. GCM10030260]|uniref:sensor histidine kinase n=1 Tax=Dankookia sp. GCM10030260 TaxID=3273390 RepID=UPI00361EE2E6